MLTKKLQARLLSPPPADEVGEVGEAPTGREGGCADEGVGRGSESLSLTTVSFSFSLSLSLSFSLSLAAAQTMLPPGPEIAASDKALGASR